MTPPQSDSINYLALDCKNNSTLSSDTSKYAILPVIYARPLLGEIQQITLTEKEITLIECALEKSVELYNKKRMANLIDLTKYKRQYFPGTTGSGDRIVWIRCICDDVIKFYKKSPMALDWRKQYSEIRDGGDCIFSLKVNLSTQMTYGFITNGSESL